MAKERGSLQGLIRARQQSGFVGRHGPVIQYRENLSLPVDDERRRFLFNIHGDAGVGKTYLAKQLRQIADQYGALTAYIDETVDDAMAAMTVIAGQLGRSGARLRDFEKRAAAYRQRRQELESDPQTPDDIAGFLTRTAVTIGLAAARGIPVAGGLIAPMDLPSTADQVNRARVYLARRLRDHADVRLLLSPAEELGPVFVADLNRVAADRSLALFIDAYERTSLVLDHWLRSLYDGRYGNLPVTLVTTISGQKPLSPGLWGDYLPVIADIPLEPFSDTEARQFLASKGIQDEDITQVILSLSGRLPMWLATLAGARPISISEIGDPAGDAVGRFLKWEEDPARRRIALIAAVPRSINQEILAEIVKPGEGKELFGWLCGLPFVTRRSEAWAYHEVVRGAMLRFQRAEAPNEWKARQEALAQVHDRWALKAAGESGKTWESAGWINHTREQAYHLLCADPEANLPRALATAVKAAEHSAIRARQWAKLITDAGDDTDDDFLRRWGKKLNEGIHGDDLTRYMSELINSGELDMSAMATALTERGGIYWIAGRREEAMADFCHAIELDPANSRAVSGREQARAAMLSPVHSAGIPAPVPPTRLHGRVREYRELLVLLRQHRLVTVTGAGGIGKTALAAAASRGFDSPARWFEFAELPPGASIVDAIASGFGLEEGSPGNLLDALAELLPDGCALVLDNVEHLDSPGMAVSALLAKREDIRILVTSRVRLGLSEEYEFPLQALEPDAARTLFLEVAGRNSGSGAIDADPAVIDRICAKLDCLPLALQLAAAWTDWLTPQDILARLEQSSRFFQYQGDGLERQVTLAATVEWSLCLLPQDAVALFKELSVYPVPWPLYIVEAVHQTQDVLDGLKRLTDYGLIRADASGLMPGFVLLQTAQDAGQSMANRESGFRASVRDRHAKFLLGNAVGLVPRLIGPDPKAAIEQISADHPHYEAALRYLTEIGDARALRLSAALWRYWQYCGKFRTGLSFIRSALRECPSDDPAARAECRYGAAVLAYLTGENEAAAADARLAMQAYQEEGDVGGVGSVMSLSGMMSHHSGRLAEAVSFYREGLRIASWDAAPRSHATLLGNLAVASEAQGNLADARSLAEQAAVRFRMLGDARNVAIQLANLARWSARAGDVDRARDLLSEAQKTFEELRDPMALREIHRELAEFALNHPRPP